MIVLEDTHPQLYARVQERNLFRQYDLLTNYIEIGLSLGPQAIDKYMLWSLNHVAVAGLTQHGGRFREEPVYVGNHTPPHSDKVSGLMDRFMAFIHENWYKATPTQLAAYGLWRLNWIHPFVDGNGRTARAVCYYLMSVRTGTLLPGKKTVPERIRESRTLYVAALQAADQAWNTGHFDVSALDSYLADLLQKQLSDR